MKYTVTITTQHGDESPVTTYTQTFDDMDVRTLVSAMNKPQRAARAKATKTPAGGK